MAEGARPSKVVAVSLGNVPLAPRKAGGLGSMGMRSAELKVRAPSVGALAVSAGHWWLMHACMLCTAPIPVCCVLFTFFTLGSHAIYMGDVTCQLGALPPRAPRAPLLLCIGGGGPSPSSRGAALHGRCYGSGVGRGFRPSPPPAVPLPCEPPPPLPLPLPLPSGHLQGSFTQSFYL